MIPDKITMRTGIILDNGDGSGSDSEGDYTEDTSDQDIEYYE